MEATTPITGKEVLEETLRLGRQIADLCLASRLNSKHSVYDAIEIARLVLDANANENPNR